MVKVILIFLYAFYICANGHNGIHADGEMESALMPQELNPTFIANKDVPLRFSLQGLRLRRDADQVYENTHGKGISSHLKRYSRIAACAVLVVSAIVEVVLYIVETYSTT